MDDGEVDSHSPAGSLLDLHSDPYFLDDSIQEDWDTLMQVCSHKHTCNPTTGPGNTHTHTCEHTHTHTIGSGDDEKLTKKRRPSGNKEAVRKYREKQKAVKVNLEVRNAELEKENQRIPELQKENARLRRKLQEQGPRQDAMDHLLAENKRLRSLLSNLRRSIDSELEQSRDDLSCQKLWFTPAKLDKGVGAYLPSGARCTAPAPCFPARPVAHHKRGGLTDDMEQMEGRLGWPMECELAKEVSICHNPQEDLEDTDVGADQSTRFGSEGTTPYSNAGTSSSGSKDRPVVCPAKLAAVAARRRNMNSGQIVAAPETGVVHQQQLPGGVPCRVVAPPWPCSSRELRQPATHRGGIVQAPQVERWQDDCGLACGDAEMTDDSSPQPPAAPLSPPENVIRSVSTIVSGPTLVPSSSKKSRVEANSSTDLFSSGCFFSDEGSPGAPATAPWNDWLDECDFIDGVCQAHLVHAIQDSCFEPSQETEPDSSRSTALTRQEFNRPACERIEAEIEGAETSMRN